MDLQNGRLRQVLGPYSAAPLGIYAIFAERGKPTSAARAFVEHVAVAIKEAGLER